MIVFKSYFKIVKKFIPILIIYTVIFMTFTVITNQSENSITDFTKVMPDVAIINNDNQSEIIETFVNYIAENTNVVNIENDEEAIQDALFFRQVTYVFIIPQNYTEDLLVGNNPVIEVKKTQDGYSTYMELMLERFIKIVDIYSKTGMNQTEICKYISNDLKQEAKITIDSNLDVSMYSKIKQYYNFSNYVFLSLCILIISEIMSSFKDEKIKRRNLVSATSFKKISIQVFLGNVSIVILVWAFYVAISIMLYENIMISKIGLLLMINSFIFTITSSAIGFLIATIVKKREAINGIVNVVALGLSFISGSFVPQKYLGSTVLGISKIFPSYWFIINNSKIVELSEFSFNSLKPVIANMGIVASYVIIIFACIGIYNKYKLNSNN